MFTRRPKISRLARRQKVDALISALSYQDLVPTREGGRIDLGASIRQQAAVALGEIGGSSAMLALIDFGMHDPAAPVRLAAVESLAGSTEAEVVVALVGAVCDWRDPRYGEARSAARHVLRELPNDAAPLLARALVDHAPSSGLDDDERLAVRELLGYHGLKARAAASALMQALREYDEDSSARVVDALVELDPWGVAELIDALNEARTSPAAAEILGRRHEGEAVDALIWLLRSGDAPARRAAATALGELRDPLAAEPLLDAINDESYVVRVAAAGAVEALGTIAMLLRLLPDSRPQAPQLRPPPRGSRPQLRRWQGAWTQAKAYLTEERRHGADEQEGLEHSRQLGPPAPEWSAPPAPEWSAPPAPEWSARPPEQERPAESLAEAPAEGEAFPQEGGPGAPAEGDAADEPAAIWGAAEAAAGDARTGADTWAPAAAAEEPSASQEPEAWAPADAPAGPTESAEPEEAWAPADAPAGPTESPEPEAPWAPADAPAGPTESPEPEAPWAPTGLPAGSSVSREPEADLGRASEPPWSEAHRPREEAPAEEVPVEWPQPEASGEEAPVEWPEPEAPVAGELRSYDWGAEARPPEGYLAPTQQWPTDQSAAEEQRSTPEAGERPWVAGEQPWAQAARQWMVNEPAAAPSEAESELEPQPTGDETSFGGWALYEPDVQEPEGPRQDSAERYATASEASQEPEPQPPPEREPQTAAETVTETSGEAREPSSEQPVWAPGQTGEWADLRILAARWQSTADSADGDGEAGEAQPRSGEEPDPSPTAGSPRNGPASRRRGGLLRRVFRGREDG
ncbi:MAG: HEAT repeat domain-containing protein [Solirubrobacterales bacterium]|nr:HEAT repeat domain-containing protein [Solirubrobacterales bacterium]MBV9474263.1 HEAT repeat domain-containing protein [Solirubrobacterales bacterium]